MPAPGLIEIALLLLEQPEAAHRRGRHTGMAGVDRLGIPAPGLLDVSLLLLQEGEIDHRARCRVPMAGADGGRVPAPGLLGVCVLLFQGAEVAHRLRRPFRVTGGRRVGPPTPGLLGAALLELQDANVQHGFGCEVTVPGEEPRRMLVLAAVQRGVADLAPLVRGQAGGVVPERVAHRPGTVVAGVLGHGDQQRMGAQERGLSFDPHPLDQRCARRWTGLQRPDQGPRRPGGGSVRHRRGRVGQGRQVRRVQVAEHPGSHRRRHAGAVPVHDHPQQGHLVNARTGSAHVQHPPERVEVDHQPAQHRAVLTVQGRPQARVADPGGAQRPPFPIVQAAHRDLNGHIRQPRPHTLRDPVPAGPVVVAGRQHPDPGRQVNVRQPGQPVRGHVVEPHHRTAGIRRHGARLGEQPRGAGPRFIGARIVHAGQHRQVPEMRPGRVGQGAGAARQPATVDQHQPPLTVPQRGGQGGVLVPLDVRRFALPGEPGRMYTEGGQINLPQRQRPAGRIGGAWPRPRTRRTPTPGRQPTPPTPPIDPSHHGASPKAPSGRRPRTAHRRSRSPACIGRQTLARHHHRREPGAATAARHPLRAPSVPAGGRALK
jgi:hypothetical protein